MGCVDCEGVGVDIGSPADGLRMGACAEQKRTGRNPLHRVSPWDGFPGLLGAFWVVLEPLGASG